MRIVVIGAGPAGLTAAYRISKGQPGVDVFEVSSSVGGLAKSLRLWGQTVDVGPHRFFSRDKRVNELWLEVVGKDYSMVNRLTRILYRNKYFSYPLHPFERAVNLGPAGGLPVPFQLFPRAAEPDTPGWNFRELGMQSLWPAIV